MSFSAAISVSPRVAPLGSGTGSCQISTSSGTSGPRYRTRGPMSRWVSLNQARAKASCSAAGSSFQRREISSNSGSKRIARSVVSIRGLCFFAASIASGTMSSASLATHWFAPAGLCSSSHSFSKRISRKRLSHWVGVSVQVTSRPEVIVAVPLPDSYELIQPRPCASSGAPSGSGPTYFSGSAAPWVLPKAWPPMISAAVSSTFIAIRPNVSLMSTAAASGSGLPFGPSGLT